MERRGFVNFPKNTGLLTFYSPHTIHPQAAATLAYFNKVSGELNKKLTGKKKKKSKLENENRSSHSASVGLCVRAI